mgnify:CR=1 FL=1
MLIQVLDGLTHIQTNHYSLKSLYLIYTNQDLFTITPTIFFMAKRGNDKFRHQPHPDKKKFHKHSSNPHIAVKKTKNISKQEELFERYKEDLGHDYSLNDIL